MELDRLHLTPKDPRYLNECRECKGAVLRGDKFAQAVGSKGKKAHGPCADLIAARARHQARLDELNRNYDRRHPASARGTRQASPAYAS